MGSGKGEKPRPETVVRVANVSLPLRQNVWRDGQSSFTGFWEGGGNFKDTESGMHGTFGNVIGGGPIVNAKWKGRDGSEQSATFTLSIVDIVKAVVQAIVDGDAEERAGGDAATSARPT